VNEPTISRHRKAPKIFPEFLQPELDGKNILFKAQHKKRQVKMQEKQLKNALALHKPSEE